NLQKNPLLANPIKLSIKNLLPSPEIQPPPSNRRGEKMVGQIGLQMSIPIILASLMVSVVLPIRREPVDPLRNFETHPCVGVVNENAGSDVHGAYKTEAIFNPGAGEGLFNMIGDVHKPVAFRDAHVEALGMVDEGAGHSVLVNFVFKEARAGVRVEDPVD